MCHLVRRYCARLKHTTTLLIPAYKNGGVVRGVYHLGLGVLWVKCVAGSCLFLPYRREMHNALIRAYSVFVP